MNPTLEVVGVRPDAVDPEGSGNGSARTTINQGMGIRSAFVVLGLACGFVSPAHASAAPGCGVDLTAPEIARAVQTLPPYPGTDWAWSAEYASGNFDRCATLSTALVSVAGATGSSPIAALMFHDGDYLGTATSRSYGFTSLNTVRTTDDTVVLNYKTPGACNACPPAAVTSVRYQWQGDHVEMLDPAPPS